MRLAPVSLLALQACYSCYCLRLPDECAGLDVRSEPTDAWQGGSALEALARYGFATGTGRLDDQTEEYAVSLIFEPAEAWIEDVPDMPEGCEMWVGAYPRLGGTGAFALEAEGLFETTWTGDLVLLGEPVMGRAGTRGRDLLPPPPAGEPPASGERDDDMISVTVDAESATTTGFAQWTWADGASGGFIASFAW